MEIDFKQALKQFPRFVFEVFVGLLYVCLTEPQTFILACLAILVGVLLGPLWGLVAFFGAYLINRLVVDVAQLVSSKLTPFGPVTGERIKGGQ